MLLKSLKNKTKNNEIVKNQSNKLILDSSGSNKMFPSFIVLLHSIFMLAIENVDGDVSIVPLNISSSSSSLSSHIPFRLIGTMMMTILSMRMFSLDWNSIASFDYMAIFCFSKWKNSNISDQVSLMLMRSFVVKINNISKKQ